MIIRKALAAASLATIAMVAGCADLEVTNPNDPDRDRTLQTATDLENLIGGGFGEWHDISADNGNSGPILMTMAYQHSATAANFGMVNFSGFPKAPAPAFEADDYHNQAVGTNWTKIWTAAASSVEGINELESGEFDVTEDRLTRARALAYFILGLAHGTAAVMYDQGYIYDPTITTDEVALHPYPEVFDASMAYFDRAIQEASGQDFTTPATWISVEVSADELVRLAHSYKARFRAALARTPEERDAVDWQAVVADIDRGINEPFLIDVRPGTAFGSDNLSNMFRFGPWGQLSYQVLGMADQSGHYQSWFAQPPSERHPNPGGDDPFLIITPDLRFAQGATVDEQRESPGRLYEISTGPGGFNAQWVRPDRGSFRWSYYRFHAMDEFANNYTSADPTDLPEITLEEMRLLRAEALYRTGDLAGAAEIINETRVEAGLNPTDAGGTNTSCVPKLPNGQCGDLFEMLKWEVRLETIFKGLFMAPWYFHGRGWGDLTEGSFLQLPIPANEAELLFIAPYTFGPDIGFAAPVGTYGN